MMQTVVQPIRRRWICKCAEGPRACQRVCLNPCMTSLSYGYVASWDQEVGHVLKSYVYRSSVSRWALEADPNSWMNWFLSTRIEHEKNSMQSLRRYYGPLRTDDKHHTELIDMIEYWIRQVLVSSIYTRSKSFDVRWNIAQRTNQHDWSKSFDVRWNIAQGTIQHDWIPMSTSFQPSFQYLLYDHTAPNHST